MAKKREIDWESLEQEYRAGQLSIREIARGFGVSDTAIRKRAKRDGWERDLSGKVKREVAARLLRDSVRKESIARTREPAAEREIIDHAAARAVEVVRGHKKHIGENLELIQSVRDELISYLANPDGDLPAIFATKGDSVSSLLNVLANSTRTLVVLERQAFNLDVDPDTDDADLAATIRASSKRLIDMGDNAE